MMNKLLTKRVVAWALAAITVLSIIPIIGISFMNHPYCDDYAFSMETHAVWRETGSLGKTLEAAFQKTIEQYNIWQGCYTVTFISALQPGVFSESLYFIVTLVLLGFLILSVMYLSKALVMDVLGLGACEAVIVASLISLLVTQLTPDPGEAFFWCNGGVAYTFIHSLFFLSVAQIIRLEGARGAVKVTLRTILLAITLLLTAGGNYSTGLFGAIVFFLITLMYFIRRSDKRFIYLGLLLVYLAGFAVNVLAPGNAARMTTMTSPMSAPRAVLGSLLYASMFVGKWTDLTLIGAAGLCVPVFVSAAKKTSFSFKRPLLITLLAYCVFATQLTPPLFAGAYLGDGRQIDVYYYTYVLMFMSLVCYWTGFIVKRKKCENRHTEGYKAAICLVMCVCMLFGAAGFDRGETTVFGLRTVTGGSALRSLLNGEAARYDKLMDEREALLNDPALTTVTLTPIADTPDVLIDDLIHGDNVPGYALNMIAEYYGKTVLLADADE